jgi:hypothetical protein
MGAENEETAGELQKKPEGMAVTLRYNQKIQTFLCLLKSRFWGANPRWLKYP